MIQQPAKLDPKLELDNPLTERGRVLEGRNLLIVVKSNANTIQIRNRDHFEYNNPLNTIRGFLHSEPAIKTHLYSPL